MTIPTGSENLTHPQYRADIDGLRAIAVLSVVSFHAFPLWARGGFIGVDIFFVISGFLISTIIFGSLERNSFSFSNFYGRRIKRIFPALLLVLITSYAFGWFALLTDEYKQLGEHIAGGAGFISNFILSSESGYFDNAAETKPLLHLWSLGIEEQFYIIWPLLLWFAWKRRWNFLTITIVVGAISFSLNILGMQISAVTVFYSPQTRFWELLIGSGLAYIALYNQNIFAELKHKLDKWPRLIGYASMAEINKQLICNALSLIGAVLISIGILVITKQRIFPGWWALLPTIGAAFIISAGSQAWLNRVVLSNRLLVWFGLISFPLYLWHWPLLSFARILASETPAFEIRIAAILISIVLAWLTYRLIETPFRVGKPSGAKTILLLVLMFVVGYVGYNCYKQDGLPFRNPTNTETYVAERIEQQFQENCSLKFKLIDSNHCAEISSGKDLVLIIGDSHVRHYFELLKKQITDSNFDLIAISNGGCPFLININTANVKDCVSKNQEVWEFIQAKKGKIKFILLAGEYSTYTTPGWLADAKGKNITFSEALEETLLKIDKYRVIFLDQIPPISFDPKKCLDRPFKITGNDFNCRVSRVEMTQTLKQYRDEKNFIARHFENLSSFNIDEILCGEQYCNAKNKNALLYFDKTHLNPKGVEYVRNKIDFKTYLH